MNNATAWRPSSNDGGSPGEADEGTSCEGRTGTPLAADPCSVHKSPCDCTVDECGWSTSIMACETGRQTDCVGPSPPLLFALSRLFFAQKRDPHVPLTFLLTECPAQEKCPPREEDKPEPQPDPNDPCSKYTTPCECTVDGCGWSTGIMACSTGKETDCIGLPALPQPPLKDASSAQARYRGIPLPARKDGSSNLTSLSPFLPECPAQDKCPPPEQPPEQPEGKGKGGKGSKGSPQLYSDPDDPCTAYKSPCECTKDGCGWSTGVMACVTVLPFACPSAHCNMLPAPLPEVFAPFTLYLLPSRTRRAKRRTVSSARTNPRATHRSSLRVRPSPDRPLCRSCLVSGKN